MTAATAWTAAQDTAAALDEAVRAILDQCYAAAVQIIRDSRQEMDAVVAYLLEKETITGAEMVAIIEGRDPAAADSLSGPKPPPHQRPPQRTRRRTRPQRTSLRKSHLQQTPPRTPLSPWKSPRKTNRRRRNRNAGDRV
ncbi:MAG: hypothetical protein ACLUNZ_07090 [Evtepia sp.]